MELILRREAKGNMMKDRTQIKDSRCIALAALRGLNGW